MRRHSEKIAVIVKRTKLQRIFFLVHNAQMSAFCSKMKAFGITERSYFHVYGVTIQIRYSIQTSKLAGTCQLLLILSNWLGETPTL